MKYAKVATIALTTLALSLSSCARHEQAEDLGAAMGNATPQSSANTVDSTTLPGHVENFPDIQALAHARNTLAIRSTDKLTIAPDADLKRAKEYPISPDCGQLTANANTFTLACGNTIELYPADTPDNKRNLTVSDQATAAVLLTDGTLITANNSDNKLQVLRNLGESTDDTNAEKNTITTERPTDQLVASTMSDRRDRVVRINREYTIIQDVHYWDNEPGAILRVGKGVGKIAPGTEGIVLAADAIGHQVSLYGSEEVIRLHQLAPVPDGPWDVAWDQTNSLVWSSSTHDATLNAYSPANGSLVEQHQVPTIADAQSLVVLDNGTVVTGSASGHGLHILTATELKKES